MTHLPTTLSLLELCCPPEVVERSSGIGMGSSPSSGVSLTGGFPSLKRKKKRESQAVMVKVPGLPPGLA